MQHNRFQDIQNHVNLQPFNTFGVRAFAKHFIELHNEESIEAFIAGGLQHVQPLMLLGGGSNILFTKDFDGLVCKISHKGISVQAEDTSTITLRVAAGEVWDDFVNYCLSHHYSGPENLALIPGSVGAAPVQNIGAYGVEAEKFIESVEVIWLTDGKHEKVDHDSCRFGYRDSIFKHALKGKVIITHVVFRLNKTFHPELSYQVLRDFLITSGKQSYTATDVAEAVRSIRRSKLPDPEEAGNAGSFFRNPVLPATERPIWEKNFPGIKLFSAEDNRIKVAAGWLIEQCGMKGYKRGNAAVHDKQALVLINLGGATGGEIKALADEVTEKVKQRFGITLTPEVNIL